MPGNHDIQQHSYRINIGFCRGCRKPVSNLFGSSVILRSHIPCVVHLSRVEPFCDIHIQQINFTLRRNDDIRRLNVPVNDRGRKTVKLIKYFANIDCYRNSPLFRNGSFFQHFLNCYAFNKLLYHDQAIFALKHFDDTGHMPDRILTKICIYALIIDGEELFDIKRTVFPALNKYDPFSAIYGPDLTVL